MAGDLRSSRKRALEIGVDKSKLEPDPNYDYQGGFPGATPGQGGNYKDSAEQNFNTNARPHDASDSVK